MCCATTECSVLYLGLPEGWFSVSYCHSNAAHQTTPKLSYYFFSERLAEVQLVKAGLLLIAGLQVSWGGSAPGTSHSPG